MGREAGKRSKSCTARAIEPVSTIHNHLVRLSWVLDLYYTNISESKDAEYLAFNALPTPQQAEAKELKQIQRDMRKGAGWVGEGLSQLNNWIMAFEQILAKLQEATIVFLARKLTS